MKGFTETLSGKLKGEPEDPPFIAIKCNEIEAVGPSA
jgi:hypothetical protein